MSVNLSINIAISLKGKASRSQRSAISRALPAPVINSKRYIMRKTRNIIIINKQTKPAQITLQINHTGNVTIKKIKADKKESI